VFNLPFVLGMTAYVIVVVALSVWAGRRSGPSTRSFFIASKSLPWYLISAGLISQALGGGSTIGLAATAANQGFSSWWKLGPIFIGVIVMALLLARPLASMQQVTHPEILEDRFGQTARATGLFYYLTQSVSSIGTQLLAFGALLSLVTGLSVMYSAAIGAVVLAAWVLLGGMLGTAWGDLLHWAIFIIGLAILVPLVYAHVGGLANILHQPGKSAQYGNIFAVTPTEALGFCLLVIPSTFSRQVYFQRLLSARSARDGLVGSIVAAVIMVPIYLLIPLLGMASHHLAPGLAGSKVLPFLFTAVFPTGVSVLFFAALASALMSSGGGEVLSAASNVTQDVFVRYLRPDGSERAQLIAARVSVVIVIGIGFGMIILIPNVLDLLLFGYYGVVGGVTLPWLAALYWRRVTTAAATASMILGGGISISFYLYQQISGATLGGANPIFYGLGVSLIVLVVGSLLGRPEYTKHAQFFRRNNITGLPMPRLTNAESGSVS